MELIIGAFDPNNRYVEPPDTKFFDAYTGTLYRQTRAADGAAWSIVEKNYRLRIQDDAASTATWGQIGGTLSDQTDLQNALNSLQADINSRVSKAGDTMTGFLVLSADPVNAMHAATKQYVDAAVTASNVLTDGHLFVGSAGNVATDVAMSGDATIINTGALTIGANKVTYAKFQQVAASSIVGNPTGALANAQAITLDPTLKFAGTTLSIDLAHANTWTATQTFSGSRGTTTITSGQNLNITTTAAGQDNQITLTSVANTNNRNRILFVQGTSSFQIGWGRPANANPFYFYYGFSGSTSDGASYGGFRFGGPNSDFAWGLIDTVANTTKFDFWSGANSATGGMAIWNTSTPGVTGTSIRFWLDATGATANAIIGNGATSALSIASTGVVTFPQGLTMADAKNITTNATTGSKIGNGGKIGFYTAAPVAQPVLNAYATDAQTVAYIGIDNLQVGTVYAQLADINTLRVAYENLRLMCDDLRAKLLTTGITA